MHERDNRLDIIRSMAILLVITVHTWSLAGVDAGCHPMLNSVYDALVGCGVPLFLMISGALSLGKVSPMREFYRKRYARLLIPFLIWSAVVYVLSAVTGKYDEVNGIADMLRLYVPYLLTNRINFAYWFVPLMALLYALTPLLQRMLQSCTQREVGGMLLVGLVLLTLRNLWPDLFLLRYTSSLLYYLWMYLAGYYLYRYDLSISIRPLPFVLCLLSFALYATGVPAANLWRCLLCACLFILLLKFPSGSALIGKASRSISDSSYAIYLFHMVLIRPLYQAIGFSGATAPIWQCILLPFLTAIGVWLICAAVCHLCKQIFPYYRFLGIA